MKSFAILGILLPALAQAYDGSVSFRDAFRAYVKMRQLEEKSRITLRRTDLEDGEKLEVSHKIAAQLSEARIDFQAFLRPDEQDLSGWERETLKKAGPARQSAPLSQTGLDFLSRAFGQKAKAWSPIEWESAGEWFGKATEDAFLKTVFAMEELPASAPAVRRSPSVVWVSDPLSRYLPKKEADRIRAERAAAKNQLEKQGFVVEDLEVGAYTRLDEQAEGLHLALAQRIESGPPFRLVSTGYASAVLLRTLDLNPGLLANPAIRGWVNVNGLLFGEEAQTRGPASLTKADRPLAEAKHELLLLREERLGPQTPLGAKFPVLNVVTLGGSHRPGPTLRESMLPDGKTMYLRSGDGIPALGNALPLLDGNAPSGQRDDL